MSESPMFQRSADDVAVLKARLRKLADEKSHLQLLIQMMQRLNPLSGLEEMIAGLIQSIGETLGGTGISLYYWLDGQLRLAELSGTHRNLDAIDDAVVADVATHPRFIQTGCNVTDGLLKGDILPDVWTWVFPLQVGPELVGIMKLENIHISAESWRIYLPTLFSHAALIISNEMRTRSRLRAEEKLTKWGQVFEHAGWGIVLGSADGRQLEMMNPAFARMHGFEVHELVGKPVVDLFAPDERLRLPDIIRQAHEAGHVTVESWHLHKDGRIFPVLLDITVVRDAEGAVQCRIVNVQDMSAIKDVEERLRKSVDALTESNIELERFAYVASHDLQEPLRTLISFSQLLERKYQKTLDGDAREFLDMIIAAATRMHSLVRDLLAYSRVSTQGHVFSPVDTGAVVRAACENLHSSIGENLGRVEIGDLPIVLGDEIQLIDLFQNLIGNAIKFRRAETIPEIRVTAAPSGTHWQFTVTDNGIGIEQEYLDQIFVIFQRLHTSTAYPGTGIGLAVCKRIVERHGGRIWVESHPGQGSAFHFTLPVHRLDG